MADSWRREVRLHRQVHGRHRTTRLSVLLSTPHDPDANYDYRSGKSFAVSRAMQTSLIASLEKAVQLREDTFGSAFLVGGKAAVRLVAQDEVSDAFAVDLYGHTAIFSEFSKHPSDESSDLTAVTDFLVNRVKLQSAIVKHFVRDRSGLGHAFQHSRQLWGDTCPDRIEIIENGIQFWIRPNEGFSCGLFLDQRENRKALALLCQTNSEVLNLFSYTCSFSVYCAMQGAKTTSVDISGRALEWGKENFEKNAIALGGHSFLRRDAVQVLADTQKKRRQFDLVIVDPPSFSRGRDGTVFSLVRDYKNLVTAAAACCRPGGYLFVSTNYDPFVRDGIPPFTGQEPSTCLELPGTPKDFERGRKTVRGVLVRQP